MGIPAVVPATIPSLIPGGLGYPADGLVEHYDFSIGSSSGMVWNSLVGFGLVCWNGNLVGSDVREGTVSNLGVTLASASSQYLLPNSVQQLLAGTSNVTDIYLLKPSTVVAGAGRDMVSDRIINGISTSLFSHWFTDTGKLLFGCRSKSSDSFQSATSVAAVVTAGSWVFLAIDIDYVAGTMKLFVNGVNTDTKSGCTFGNTVFVPETPTGISDRFGIDAEITAGRYFNGIFKDSLLYRKSFSPSEHKAMSDYAKETLLNLGQTAW